jgi:hypothetical protein
LTRSSMSLHSLELWLFETPLRPIACTSRRRAGSRPKRQQHDHAGGCDLPQM